MKQITLFFIGVLFVGTALGQTIQEHKDAHIWGISHRNTDAKGCGINLETAQLYSMRKAVKKKTGSDVDLLSYYGKLGKTPHSFYLVAPLTPGLTIDWDKDKGARPYNAYTGPKSDMEGPAHLKNWPVRNATKVAKVNLDYDRATEDDIATLQLPDTYMVPVAEGDVVAFETATTATKPSKKGLIKIGSMENDSDRPTDGDKPHYQKLNLQIKVQR